MLDAGREYSLQQTLDEHSSSITAVKFAGGAWETEELQGCTSLHLPPCLLGGGGAGEGIGKYLRVMRLGGKTGGIQSLSQTGWPEGEDVGLVEYILF